jgi:hypothetical protein
VAPCVAEDRAAIAGTATATLPGWTLGETMAVCDFNPLDGRRGTRVYTRGVGLIQDDKLDSISLTGWPSIAETDPRPDLRLLSRRRPQRAGGWARNTRAAHRSAGHRTERSLPPGSTVAGKGAAMEKEANLSPGRAKRWRRWRERRKRAAREGRAWAEERVNKERYNYHGGGGAGGPSGGDGGGGL